MNFIFVTIYDFLNSILPIDFLDDFLDLNKILAYFLTISIIYLILVKPIYNLLRKR